VNSFLSERLVEVQKLIGKLQNPLRTKATNKFTHQLVFVYFLDQSPAPYHLFFTCYSTSESGSIPHPVAHTNKFIVLMGFIKRTCFHMMFKWILKNQNVFYIKLLSFWIISYGYLEIIPILHTEKAREYLPEVNHPYFKTLKKMHFKNQ